MALNCAATVYIPTYLLFISPNFQSKQLISLFFLGIESSRVGGNGSGDGDLVSPRSHEGHVRRPSKASSLADDILAIRAALDGASASARERTLKTLERLTERLALAESERDMALGKLLVANMINNKLFRCFHYIFSRIFLSLSS